MVQATGEPALARLGSAQVDEATIRCEECHREVDEFTAAAEQWHFWSDGRRLLPYCPACSERGRGVEETEPVSLVPPGAASNGT